MWASLDFDKYVSTFRRQKGVTRMPLVTEGSLTSLILSDEFTANDDESNHDDDRVCEAEKTDEHDGGESSGQDTGSSPKLVVELTEKAVRR